MKRIQISSALLLTMAMTSMLAALFCSVATFATNDHRTVLVAMFVFCALADSACLVVWLSGGATRWLAGLIAAPALFIARELVRRSAAFLPATS